MRIARTWWLVTTLALAIGAGCGNVTVGTGGGEDSSSVGDGSSVSDGGSVSDSGSGSDGGEDATPDTSTPDTSEPDTSTPDATEPDTAVPDASDPSDGGAAGDVDAAVDDGSADCGSGCDVLAPGGDVVGDAGSDGTGPDAMTDTSGPAPGCCKVDADCNSGEVCFFGPWNAGKCMKTDNLDKGKCWTDAQCGGGTCEGAIACGCDAFCKAMDAPGTCKQPNGGCTVVDGKSSGCALNEYCALPVGQCSGAGSCAPTGGMCSMQYDPVCGCDGKNYGNACSAASSGANIVGKGECTQVNKCLTVKCGDGNVCTDDTCDPATGQCNYVANPGAACDDGNACTNGDACAEENGKAYCKAGGEKPCPTPAPCELISCNAKTGNCDITPDPSCGSGGSKCSEGMGAPTIDCGKGNYCKLPAGTCAGFGTCEPMPMACFKIYEPVCGCDGTTYGNDCEAGSSGQNWGSKGACGPVGGGCCKDDSQCKGGVCANSVCKDPGTLKPGYCWTDAQCGGSKCSGASICPCGANCLLPDSPGKCAAIK